jgi:hypothetical protein
MKVKLNPKNTRISQYEDLTPGNIYRVIGIEADSFRIMSDMGAPYLYNRDLFLIVDSQEPNNWETEYGEDGERYSYPKDLGQPGFFEDYFDYKLDAITKLRKYLYTQWIADHSG